MSAANHTFMLVLNKFTIILLILKAWLSKHSDPTFVGNVLELNSCILNSRELFIDFIPYIYRIHERYIRLVNHSFQI